MSQARQTTRPIGQVQRRHPDPLAEIGHDEQVLRCDDPETGWRWYYDVRDGEVYKHHEYHEFAGEAIERERVGECVWHERVEAVSVSRVHLDILRGEE